MEKPIIDNIAQVQASPEIKDNPYANGKGRAIVERLFRESREAKEQAVRQYQQNPEIRAFYARLKQQQKEADKR